MCVNWKRLCFIFYLDYVRFNYNFCLFIFESILSNSRPTIILFPTMAVCYDLVIIDISGKLLDNSRATRYTNFFTL